MKNDGNFTHIIVGAGSGGCVLAARIAENPDFNVLLLEAGPDCNELKSPHGIQDVRRVPMKGQSETFDERIDWNIRVDLPGGGEFNVAQAKVVGGGSSINGGTALRNTVNDCKKWVELGNDAWDWKSVECVYAELEEDEMKGTKGPHPLVRTKYKETGAIQKAFVDGAIDSKWEWADDLNATGVEGVGASPVCRRGHTRISTATTFIDPIRNKLNFDLLTNATVDRILFSARKATGVLLANQRQILASTEVILSAGAVFSPALLQRSGIGPGSLLSSLSIPILQDLPVGASLADHCCVPVVARPKPNGYTEADSSLQMQARWSSALRPGAIDLQLVCFSYLYMAPAAPPIFVSPSNTPYHSPRGLGGSASGHVAGIGCNVNKPTSEGSVRIRSKDPSEQPSVAPNYLVTTSDQTCAREAVRMAYRIIQSEAMQRVLSPPLGLTPEIIASDSTLDEWINSQYCSTYHFSSTCRMAARDLGGVVDQSGCVYGVHGLRVADASVIPTIPAANTMWTTVLFADRIGRSVRDRQPVEQLLRP